MYGIFLSAARYMLILFFGVFASAAIADIRLNKKNLLILIVFYICNCLIQLVILLTDNIQHVILYYPVITHLPLFLLFVLVFKKTYITSLVAITSAYLCCQICNWSSTIPRYMGAASWIVDITYIAVLIPLFLIVMRCIAPSMSKLYTKENTYVLMFGIVPVFYYVFDYASTVYTRLLYGGNIIITEFVPFLLCLYYIIFCIVYYHQYEEKQRIATENMIMDLKQSQYERDIKAFERNEKAVRLIRHDMLHFLNNISVLIETGQTVNAQKYIQEIINTTRSTDNKKYCSNKMINMILSLYGDTFDKNNISFSCNAGVPEQISVSDIDITSILSNALENALNAVLPLEQSLRTVNLKIIQKDTKLLILISNPYCDKKPVLTDGYPVSREQGHGFGTQSIRHTVEKLHGNCKFSVTDREFVLQIII